MAMALCPAHLAGTPPGEQERCPVCHIQELRRALAVHIQEYRQALGETLHEKEELEKLLDGLYAAVEQLPSISPAAVAYLRSDPAVAAVARWVKVFRSSLQRPPQAG